MKRSFNQANLTSDNPPGVINPSVLELFNKIDSTNRNIKELSEYLNKEQVRLTQNDIMIQCNDIQESTNIKLIKWGIAILKHLITSLEIKKI